MATSILARPQPAIDPDVFALAEEIADEEGIGFPLARLLAELQVDELLDYAHDWVRA